MVNFFQFETDPNMYNIWKSWKWTGILSMVCNQSIERQKRKVLAAMFGGNSFLETLSHPEALPWKVKSSDIRQSKISNGWKISWPIVCWKGGIEFEMLSKRISQALDNQYWLLLITIKKYLCTCTCKFDYKYIICLSVRMICTIWQPML